ncbi:hypothetical protein D3Z47_19590 [Lachnospiraceae bacterium]|nr:hypothetical protein [Lachnospiraceae bacterium]
MADIRKQKFYTVETSAAKANAGELERKIRIHRKKIAASIAAAAITITVIVITAGLYYNFKEYQSFEIRSQIERNDSKATKYESFAGNILRYNNDGAFYLDTSDNPIWNQAFEMQEPVVDIHKNYMAVADLYGNQIYIMDNTGTQGSIKTTKPIEAISIASQGTIAVLAQQDGVSYLELYNKNGENLASGQIRVTNSGYPLDIALSEDATKLAVSILDISKGTAQTTVSFYNFSSVGQNEIDNMVGSYTYADTVVPEVAFTSNSRLIAFGDNKVILFEGMQKPEEKLAIELEKEVKSIFYDNDYFGLVYSKGDSADSHQIQVYSMDGEPHLEQDFTMPYQKIEFLDNHEICIRDEFQCTIYTLRGVKKFTYKFDNALYKIFSGKTGRRYTFILDGVMEQVKLK